MFLSKTVEVCTPSSGKVAEAARGTAARWSRRITAGHPHLLIVAAVLALTSGAWFLSFLLRFEFTLSPEWKSAAVQALPFVLIVQALFFTLHGVFRILWPYVSTRDALVILRSSIYSTATLLALNAIL